jgi:hypothetical protein
VILELERLKILGTPRGGELLNVVPILLTHTLQQENFLLKINQQSQHAIILYHNRNIATSGNSSMHVPKAI